MTTHPVPSSSDPRHILATARELARHVRREQRGAWFPLLVFAAVTFAAAPFDRLGRSGPTHCVAVNGGLGQACTLNPAPTMWYWPTALLLAYAAVSWFYVHRSGKLGIGTRVRPYLVAGTALILLSTAVGLYEVAHPAFIAELQLRLPYALRPVPALLGPAGVIGLTLLLLARIERSWTLLTVTCAYLVAILLTSYRDAGPGIRPAAWEFLPHLLLDGCVLLLGGVVLALVQRAQGRPAA